MKKMLTFAIVLAMLATVLIGCQSPTRDADEPNSDAASKGTDAPVTAKPAADDPEGSIGDEPASIEPISLLMWSSGDKEQDFLKKMAEKYTAEVKTNVTIEFESVGHTDSTGKIVLDGPAGVAADCFTAPHDKLGELVMGGHVAANTNSDHIQNEMMDAAVTAATYGGTMYATPYAIETYALFYNKDLVDTVPKTWDDVISFCSTFNDNAANKYGIVFEPGNAYYSIMYLMGFGSQLFGANGDDASDHQINSEKSIQGVEYFQRLRKQILDVNAADLNNDFCTAAFTEGNTAMYITGPWKIANFTELGLNFGITTLPSFPGQSTPAPSFSGVRLYCVSAYSSPEKQEAAQEWLDWLTSVEVQKELYPETGHIPTQKTVTIENEYASGILEQAKYAVPMPSIPEMGQYWTSMGSAYSLVWDGDGTNVKTELDAAAVAIEAATAGN